MSLTTKDIAKIAGVSQSTVSRSLNDSPLISDATKQRVKQIAYEQGFQFNANARSLSTSKTGTVSMVYPEDFADFSLNLYFSSLVNQIRESLERADLDLIVTFQENRFTGQSSIKKLVTSKKVDGFILVQSQLNLEMLTFLQQSKIPFVFLHLNPSVYKEQSVDSIFTDHFTGGYLAAEHLIKSGRKSIACVSVQSQEEEFALRTAGFKAAHQDNGLICNEDLIWYGDRSFPSGYQRVIDHKKELPGIDGIFAQTDLMALGALEALKELGIAVPREVGVVGYDDIELCTYFRPYLTTIHQPREEIARLTCERLIELIGAKKKMTPKKVGIRPHLVIRDSCGS